MVRSNRVMCVHGSRSASEDVRRRDICKQVCANWLSLQGVIHPTVGPTQDIYVLGSRSLGVGFQGTLSSVCFCWYRLFLLGGNTCLFLRGTVCSGGKGPFTSVHLILHSVSVGINLFLLLSVSDRVVKAHYQHSVSVKLFCTRFCFSLDIRVTPNSAILVLVQRSVKQQFISFCFSVISATPVIVISHPVLCSYHIIIICSYAESHWTCQTFCLTLVVSPPFFRFPPPQVIQGGKYFSLIRISLCLKCLKYGLALYSFRSMGIMILNYAF